MLKSGESFVIYDDRLPPEECYLEHPDGSIELVWMPSHSKKYSVKEKLGPVQVELLRRKFDFRRV